MWNISILKCSHHLNANILCRSTFYKVQFIHQMLTKYNNVLTIFNYIFVVFFRVSEWSCDEVNVIDVASVYHLLLLLNPRPTKIVTKNYESEWEYWECDHGWTFQQKWPSLPRNLPESENGWDWNRGW